MKNTNTKKKPENDKAEKASDSDNSNLKNQEPEDDVFTQEKFEDALRRVSRPICEPDEETT